MTQHQILIEEEGQLFSQADGDTLLRAALRAGVGFPYECSSGGCGSCKFELLEGEVENLWPEAPGLSERDRRKKRLLACQCRARGPLRISVRTAAEYQPAIVPLRRRAEFVDAAAVTHDLHEFRFRAADPADFLAGQYALLSIPGVPTSRAYSMSNLANAHGEWHFQIRLVAAGEATDRLFHHLQKGDSIEIDGPYGLAYLREASSRDIVCVAGGSGLAPILSIARGASRAGMLKDRHLHFFYGARTPHDLCGETFLRELPEYGERIHYYPVISQAAETAQEPWHGASGFVHEHVRQVFGAQMPLYEFYFAGPPPMTQALQEMLMLEHRVPFEQLHFDRFF
ncbi:MAG: 2Fe-2S iron-sulfur cluster-binding protein [Proteobacteria bacterium]|nr:2Fe-2S iron-sulfur cluster-binding protein [Pseudomonadota bacterium]